MYKSLFIAFLLLGIVACHNKQTSLTSTTDTLSVNMPDFKEDSAYLAIQQQCDFGARTLGSKAHEQCGLYIVNEFKRMGCETSLQETTFVRYDGKAFNGYNIIAQTNPSAKKHIVICTHWDSRPWCDADPDSSKWRQPVLAANDGASGIGVMIELARIIQQHPLPFCVDFVCFDAEDMGTPSWIDSDDDADTWCLGSQYWAKHPHSKSISYGILLDMVGGQGATFAQERFSMRYASNIVNKVWSAATNAGFKNFFPTEQGGYITDDHLPMNQIAHVPTINIIPYYSSSNNVFGPVWHTSYDTMANISTSTLKAVGQTLVQLLYTEEYDN